MNGYNTKGQTSAHQERSIVPKASRNPNPHTRTRNDHSQETAEDYVEAIDDLIAQRGTCRISDLAKRFAVSHVTVHRIVARLQGEGLLETQPYRPVSLTSKGKQLADLSRHRHEVVYQFLLALGVTPKTAAIDTEGIEHHVSPETLRKMELFTRQVRPT